MKSNLSNEKFSFCWRVKIFQVVRKKVGKSKSKQSLNKKANNGKQIKVKSAWASHCLPQKTTLWYTHRVPEGRTTKNVGFEWTTNKLRCFRGNLAQLWNEVMLKSGKKYRPAVKNGHSKKKKLKAGKVSSCLFVPGLQRKFPPALGFLIWFSSKIEMVNYVDVYYYKLLQHFCSILRPSHLPSLIPTIPNAQHKERQLDKTFVFFLSLQQQIGLKTQIVIASRSLWSIRPAIIQIKILYCVSTFEGTWKVQFGKILLNLFPKFLSSHCLVASQPLAS